MGKWRRVTMEMNPETGELRPRLPKQTFPDDEQPEGEPAQKVDVGFFRVYRVNWAQVVEKKLLRTAEIALLFSMMAFADWNTNRLVHPAKRTLLSIADLARLLEMDRKHVGEMCNTLHEKGFIFIGTQDSGVDKYIVINPNLMWFGKKMDNAEEHLKMFTECEYDPAVRVLYIDAKKR